MDVYFSLKFGFALETNSLVGHTSWVLSVDFHSNGNSFVTGSSDSTVKLWDFQSRSCVQTLTDNSDQVRISVFIMFWKIPRTHDLNALFHSNKF